MNAVARTRTDQRDEAAIAALRDCAALTVDARVQAQVAATIEDYLDGFKAGMPYGPDKSITLYALPWSRGWSIFATMMPNPSVYDWRNVRQAHRPFQHVLYAPRDQIGAHHISCKDLADAFIGVASLLSAAHERKVRWHASRNKTHAS